MRTANRFWPRALWIGFRTTLTAAAIVSADEGDAPGVAPVAGEARRIAG